MNKILNIGVIGGGKFGTALATVVARRGHNVLIYEEIENRINEINASKINTSIFNEEVILPDSLEATTDLKKVMESSNILIHAIPVQVSYNFIKQNIKIIPENIPYIISSKGMLLNQKKFFSEIWKDLTENKKIPHCVLSGPSFAIEMIKNFPTEVSLGCKDEEIGKFICRSLSSQKFVLHNTTDIVGVEIGGALKNPLAIAAGIVEGVSANHKIILRTSTSAALIVRGMNEMSLFYKMYGGRKDTLFGLSGFGDIMLTCMGELSRDKAFGKKIAQGLTLSKVPKTELVEGIATSKIIGEIIEKENLDMPIYKKLYQILHKNHPHEDLLKML